MAREFRVKTSNLGSLIGDCGVLDDNEEIVHYLEQGDIILNSDECKILYFELAHHTCFRDHYSEFSAIFKKIAASSQEKIIERAKDNLSKDKS